MTAFGTQTATSCCGRCEPLTDFGDNAVKALSEALNGVLADALGLYLKTKNFHWHVSDRDFRNYHLLFDEQAGQILSINRRFSRARAKDRRRDAPLAQPSRGDDAGAANECDRVGQMRCSRSCWWITGPFWSPCGLSRLSRPPR
jgi:hypothetical protein